MPHFIYVVENTLTAQRYVGQTTNFEKRQDLHVRGRSCVKFLNRAIAKYGASHFDFSLLEACANKQAADDRERYWIKEIGTLAPAGYNLTEGGGGISGYSWSSKQKAYLSKVRKGRKFSQEHCQNISKARLGANNPMYGRSGTLSPTYGRKHSEETKRKMSLARKAYYQRKQVGG